MKKTIALFLAILLIGSVGVLAACKDDTPKTLTKIEIVSSSVKTEYYVGETIDLSGLKVNAIYSDKSTTALGFQDVTCSAVSSDQVGKQVLTVTYKEKEASIDLTILNPDDDLSYLSFDAPKNYDTYLQNIMEKENKDTEYVNRTDGYYVGSQNGFRFVPTITAMNGLDQRVIVTKYESTLQLFEKRNGAYVELTGADKSIVTVDDAKHTYQFAAGANGKEYKLVIGLTDTYGLDDAVTIEVKVVDGYNIYTTEELSLLDNHQNEHWAALKTQYGLKDVVANKALILHNDIAVKPEHIPTDFLYTKGDSDITPQMTEKYGDALYGSLRDGGDHKQGTCTDVGYTQGSIYDRSIPDGETFEFVGNYFTINSEAVPMMVCDRGQRDPGNQESHQSLIGFAMHKDSASTTGTANVRNVYLKGNSGRSENLTAAGTLMISTNIGTTNIDNVIGYTYFTFFLHNNFEGTLNIKDSKMFNAFSNHIYSWGGKALNLVNSTLKVAGGPSIVLTCVNPESANDKHVANLNVDDKTVIEAWTAGTEKWYQINNAASAVGMIKALSQLFVAQGKTFTKGDLINIKVVVVGDKLLSNQYPLLGNVTIDGENAIEFDLSKNPILNGYKSNPAVAASGAPIFQIPFTNPLEAATTTMISETAIDTSNPAVFDKDENLITIYAKMGPSEYIAALLEYLNV